MGRIPLALILVVAVFFDRSEACSCMGIATLADNYCNEDIELKSADRLCITDCHISCIGNCPVSQVMWGVYIQCCYQMLYLNVLRGVAVNRTLVNDGGTDYSWDDVMSYEFQITEIIKATGNSSRSVEERSVVYVEASMNEAMCGTSLKLGVDYVIVFSGSFWISLCDWKQPYLEMEPWDRAVFEDNDFNCITRDCFPMGDDAVVCCHYEQRSGGTTCAYYQDCVTVSVPDGETTRCCTASGEESRECIDYPGRLLKK